MSNYLKIYWLTRLDYLQGLAIGAGVCIGLLILLHYIFYYASNDFSDDPFKLLKGWLKPFAITMFIVSVIASCLVPTKNEAILIMAGGKTMDFVQNDSSLNKIPAQATAIISDYLDKQLKETKK